jgi:hypothetical protein
MLIIIKNGNLIKNTHLNLFKMLRKTLIMYSIKKYLQILKLKKIKSNAMILMMIKKI